MVKRIRVVKTV